jgi:hypothetical protein
MPKLNDIIYTAGFVDGEGCLTTSHACNFRVTVSNTNISSIKWLKSKFGGCINNQHLPKNPKWTESWKWVLTTKSGVLRFLKLVYPYLKIKKAEAKIIIKYLEKNQGKKAQKDNKDFEAAKAILKKLKKLKTF